MARTRCIWVDHTVCVGHAMCEASTPQVFQHNANRWSDAVNQAAHPQGDDGRWPQEDLRSHHGHEARTGAPRCIVPRRGRQRGAPPLVDAHPYLQGRTGL